MEGRHLPADELRIVGEERSEHAAEAVAQARAEVVQDNFWRMVRRVFTPPLQGEERHYINIYVQQCKHTLKPKTYWKLNDFWNLQFLAKTHTADFKVCCRPIWQVTKDKAILNTRSRTLNQFNCNTVSILSSQFWIIIMLLWIIIMLHWNKQEKNIYQTSTGKIFFYLEDSTQAKDTGHFAILIYHQKVAEISGYALRNDLLQRQTSSVVNMGIWYDGAKLLAEPHRPLKDSKKEFKSRPMFRSLTIHSPEPTNTCILCWEVGLTPLGLSDVVIRTLGFVSRLK